MKNQAIPDHFEVQTMEIPPSVVFLKRFKILSSEANAMLTPIEVFFRNAMEIQYHKQLEQENKEIEKNFEQKMISFKGQNYVDQMKK